MAAKVTVFCAGAPFVAICLKNEKHNRPMRRRRAYNPVDVGQPLPFRILVVDGEAKMAEALREGLRAEGHAVVAAATHGAICGDSV